HFGARGDLLENVVSGLDELRSDLEARVRDNSVFRVALVNHRLENLHALLAKLRATQPPNQLFTLAGEHRSDDHLDPAHVALHDIHASSPPAPRLAQHGVEIEAAVPATERRSRKASATRAFQNTLARP